MTRQAIEEAISMLGNAYMQFLLYKNKIIKSTALNTAHNQRDMAKKLSFFLKTHWIRDLEAASLSDVATSIKIKNGSVQVDFPYERWSKAYTFTQKMVSGHDQCVVENHGLQLGRIRGGWDNNTSDMHLLSLRSDTFGNDFSVTFHPDTLKQKALEQRAAATDIDPDFSYLKTLYDTAFTHLKGAREVVKPVVEYRKKMRAIADTGTASGFKDDYHPSASDIIYFVKGYGSADPNGAESKVAWTNLLQAINLTYVYAKANDKLADLDTNLFDVVEEATTGADGTEATVAYKGNDVFEKLQNMHGYGRRDDAIGIARCNQLQTWIESVSRILRGVGDNNVGS